LTAARAWASRHDMEHTRIEICNTPWPGRPGHSFPDFKIGRIVLSRHFGITRIGVLSLDKNFGRQLLLRQPSAFRSGRVPLYVCACCADLGCGALTVSVEKTDGGIVWRDFGWEWTDGGGISQPGYLAGAGPYVFDAGEYRTALHPYMH
jgi:hypothetical protein